MIAFCCVTTDEDVFRAGAATAMQAVIEADSLLMRRHVDSLAGPCNEMLAHAAARPDLEAVVLIDQATTIEAGDFLERVRSSLGGGRDVAVVGAAPAPEIAGLVASRQAPPSGEGHEVDAVDGTLLALSPWAARELSFDPTFDPSIDGCAVDLCLQARSQGRGVLAGGLGAVRRPASGGIAQRESLVTSLRRKWHA